MFSNKFIGNFPNIDNYFTLTDLNIAFNRFSGSLNSFVNYNTRTLRKLNIFDNQFNGQLPYDLYSFSSLQEL